MRSSSPLILLSSCTFLESRSETALLERIFHWSMSAAMRLQISRTPGHGFPWKHISLRNFQMAHKVAVQVILMMEFLFSLNHRRATDSKSVPTDVEIRSEITGQTNFATKQSKKRCWQVSVSEQNKQDLSSTWRRLAKLSRVNSLLLAKSHKNICNRGGTCNFQAI